jgi:DNA processing protein
MGEAVSGISSSLYWLALALTPGLGLTRGRKLAEHFPNLEDVFHASRTELESLQLEAQSAQHIALGKSLELAHAEYAKAIAAGVRIITRDDPDWPLRLNEIYDPPWFFTFQAIPLCLLAPG